MAVMALAAFLIVAIPQNSSGATYVVDDDNGTWRHYSTIGAAISGVNSTDTIEIYAGTYTEDLSISKALTFVGNGSGTVVAGDHDISVEDVYFDSINFTNPTPSDYTFVVDASSGNLDGLGWSNCIFVLEGYAGIHLGGDVGSSNTLINVAITDCEFWGPSSKAANPFKTGGTFGTPGLGVGISTMNFTGNSIIRASIPILLEDNDISGVYFDDNTFTGTDGVVYFWGNDTPSGVLTDFEFTNNEVDDTNSYGVGIGYPNGTFTSANLGTGNLVNYNNIDVAGAYGMGGVSNFMGGSLDATMNWWGASDGPSGSGPGSGSPISHDVTFNPFYDEMVGNVSSSLVIDIDGDETFDGFVGEVDDLTIDDGSDVTFMNSVVTVAGDLDVSSGTLTLIDTTLYVGDVLVSSGGTWVVGDSKNTVYAQNINISGNTTWDASNIMMDCTSDLEYHIWVHNGGELNIINDTMVSRNGSFNYEFQLQTGGALFIKDSIIEYIGSSSGTGNGEYGLYLGASATIVNGTFRNSYNGILTDASGIDISMSTFGSNTRYDLRTVSSDDVMAEDNYWGSVDEVDIRTGIHDSVENAGLGTVDYSPWYDATFMTQYNTDTDAPSITINMPMDNSTYNAMVEINATVTDLNRNDTDVWYRWDMGTPELLPLDSGDWFSIMNDTTLLMDGTHNLTVIAYDEIGNQAMETTEDIIIDNGLPTIFIDSPGEGLVIGGSVEINSSVVDDNRNDTDVWYWWDSDAPTILPYDTGDFFMTSFDTTTLSDGVHNLTVKAVDELGNENMTTVENIEVDNTAPTIVILEPTADEYESKRVNVTVNITDANRNDADVWYWFTDEGPAALPFDSGDTFSGFNNTLGEGITEGYINVTIRAIDLVGNSADAVVNFTLDNTAPTIVINLPGMDDVIAGVVDLNATITDDNLDTSTITFRYFLNDPTDLPVHWGDFYTASNDSVAEGWLDDDANVTVMASDLSGNMAQETVDIIIDNTAPVVNLGLITDTTIGSTSLVKDGDDVSVYALVTDDNIHNITANLTDLGGSMYETPTDENLATGEFWWNLTGVTCTPSDGEINVSVVTYDEAMASDSDHSITLSDNTAPMVAINMPTESDIMGGNITINATVTDLNRNDTDVWYWSQNKGPTLLPLITGDWFEATNDSAAYGWKQNNNVITVKAVDLAGNEKTLVVNITVDNTIPSVEITAPLRNDEIAGEVTITATVTDTNRNDTDVWFWYDGIAPALLPYDSDDEFTITVNSSADNWTDGRAYINIKAVDLAGNENSTETVRIDVDNTAPTITYVHPLNGTYHAGTIPVNVTVADVNRNDGKVRFWIDDMSEKWRVNHSTENNFSAELVTINTEKEPPKVGVDDGIHTMIITAEDTYGNKGRETIEFFVDNKRPLVNFISPLDGEYYNGTFELNITVTDTVGRNNSAVWYWFDGDEANPIQLPYNTGDWFTTTIDTVALGWEDGEHTLDINTTDLAGNYKITNTNGSSQTITFTVDNTIPEINVTSFMDGDYLSGTVDIRILINETNLDEDDVWYWWNEEAMDNLPLISGNEFGTTFDTETVSDGLNNISFMVVDLAGNSNMTSIVNLIFDNTVPEIFIQTPLDDAVVDGWIEVNVSVIDLNIGNENESVYYSWQGDEHSLNATGDTYYNTTINTSRLTEGSSTFTIYTYDNASNYNSAQITIIIDRTDPVLFSDTLTDGSFALGTYDLEVEVTETNINQSMVFYTFNGTDYPMTHLVGITYNATFNTSHFADGLYQIEYKAYDLAGHFGNTTHINITIDNTLPELELLSPMDNSLLSGDVTISVNVNDTNIDNSSVSFLVTGNLEQFLSNDTTPDDWHFESVNDTVDEDWEEGNLTITIRAIDLAGNMNETSIDVVLDNTDPGFSDVMPEENEFLNGTFTISVTIDEDHLDPANVTWHRSGEDFEPMDTDDNITFYKVIDTITDGWDDGVETITIRAIDNATNRNTQDILIVIDNTFPTIEIIDPEEGAIVLQTHTFVAEVDDDTTTTSLLTVEIDLDGDGDYDDEMDHQSTDGTVLTYSHEETNMDIGPYRLDVRVTDRAGNSANMSVNYTVRSADIVDPQVEIVYPDICIEDVYYVDDTDFTFSVRMIDESFNETGIEYELPDSEERFPMDYDSFDDVFEADLQLLEDEYMITIHATDASENYRKYEFDVVVDATAPNVTITSVATDGAVGANFSLKATVKDKNDDRSAVMWNSDINTTFAPMEWKSGNAYSVKVNTTEWDYGTFSMTVEAYDLAGNKGSATVVNVEYEETVPIVDILTPEADEEILEEFNFTVEITDDYVDPMNVWLVLDDEPEVQMWINNDTEDEFWRYIEDIDVGYHWVEVYTEDLAGNWANASLKFRVVKTEEQTIRVGGGIEVIVTYQGNGVTAEVPDTIPTGEPANRISLDMYVEISLEPDTTLLSATIEFSYAAATGIKKIDKTAIEVYVWGSWILVGDYTNEPGQSVITANVDEVGIYAVFGGEKEDSTGPSDPSGDGGGGDDAGLPMELILIIVVVVVVVLVLVMRKKKKGEEVDTKEPAKPDAQFADGQPTGVVTGPGIGPLAPLTPPEPKPAPALAECSNCGAIIRMDAKECPKCGAVFDEDPFGFDDEEFDDEEDEGGAEGEPETPAEGEAPAEPTEEGAETPPPAAEPAPPQEGEIPPQPLQPVDPLLVDQQQQPPAPPPQQ